MKVFPSKALYQGKTAAHETTAAPTRPFLRSPLSADGVRGSEARSRAVSTAAPAAGGERAPLPPARGPPRRSPSRAHTPPRLPARHVAGQPPPPSRRASVLLVAGLPSAGSGGRRRHLVPGRFLQPGGPPWRQVRGGGRRRLPGARGRAAKGRAGRALAARGEAACGPAAQELGPPWRGGRCRAGSEPAPSERGAWGKLLLPRGPSRFCPGLAGCGAPFAPLPLFVEVPASLPPRPWEGWW